MGNDINSFGDLEKRSNNNKKMKRRRSNSLNSRDSKQNQNSKKLQHSSSRYVSFIVKESSFVAIGVDDDGNKTINEYTVLSTLGSGSFAKVKLCVNSRTNKPFVKNIF
jgi:hypothetical protein